MVFYLSFESWLLFFFFFFFLADNKDGYPTQKSDQSSFHFLFVSINASFFQPSVLTYSHEIWHFNWIFLLRNPLLLNVKQVVQFYQYKATTLQISEYKMEPFKVVPISTSHQDKIRGLKLELVKDRYLAETIFRHGACGESLEHEWADFSRTVGLWEAYTTKLWNNMVLNLPKWIANQSIFLWTQFWILYCAPLALFIWRIISML